MTTVRGNVTRWVATAFPGWVEIVFVDADGKAVEIVDKLPTSGSTSRRMPTSRPRPTSVRSPSTRRDLLRHEDGGDVAVVLVKDQQLRVPAAGVHNSRQIDNTLSI
jgi:hypothetical protein